MTRFLLQRLLWFVPMLFGITLLTFVLLEWLPIDRAEAEVQASMQGADAEQRAMAVHRLRVRMGMIDAESGAPIPLWQRYARWLKHAARFDFSSPGADEGVFRVRFREALTVSVLIGLLAVGLAVFAGIAVGTWAGTRCGSVGDRALSGLVLAGYSLPEFLIATLLLLLLGGGVFEPVLPTSGLRTEGSETWSGLAQVLDLAAHLVMPVLTLAIVPFVIVVRHVREAVSRAAGSEFAATMRNWGLPERVIKRRLLRHGLAPVATLIGTLLPATIGGSVVVEQAFAIPGIGRMAFRGVLDKDVGVVMAITLLVSVVTLVALTLSDVMHRVVDKRVELR